MKYLSPSFLAMVILVSTMVEVRAQDSAFGELPPLPNLNLGDPDTEPTRAEKRMRAKIREKEREQEEAISREKQTEQQKQTFAQRLSSQKASAVKRAPVSQKITVNNSLPANEDGITASGSRLKPFGDEGFWAGMPDPTPEEMLIDLPPLPDLRTPDQVTRKERFRDLRIAKSEVREAESDAARQLREAKARAVVNRPAADPSSALVQVESRRGTAGYVGNQSAPETVNETTLKPFNENSSYYRDGQLVYKGPKVGGNTGASSGSSFWKRLTNKD